MLTKQNKTKQNKTKQNKTKQANCNEQISTTKPLDMMNQPCMGLNNGIHGRNQHRLQEA
jgi:hypothetical protein